MKFIELAQKAYVQGGNAQIQKTSCTIRVHLIIQASPNIKITKKGLKNALSADTLYILRLHL